MKCKKCKADKPDSDFYKRKLKNGNTANRRECKACRNEQGKTYVKSLSPEKQSAICQHLGEGRREDPQVTRYVLNVVGMEFANVPRTRNSKRETPNDKVSYHADNAGGAHGKDTNDK